MAKQEATLVEVKNIHASSKINGIRPGEVGKVRDDVAERYPMYFERIAAPQTEGKRGRARKGELAQVDDVAERSDAEAEAKD